MPSSLIVAALAVAWLVVLVPMFARRRQEVTRTAESALAARVIRRGSARAPRSGGKRKASAEEAFAMSQVDERTDTELDSEEPRYAEDGWRRVHSDDVRAGRRYRPGRGGFDPEAAALAARAKYAFRQRVVLAMLLFAVLTGVIAAVAVTTVWWLHALVDVSLVGYLTYLRRQVRIEEDVRQRRLARMSGGRSADGHYDDYAEYGYDEYDERDAGGDYYYADERYEAQYERSDQYVTASDGADEPEYSDGYGYGYEYGDGYERGYDDERRDDAGNRGRSGRAHLESVGRNQQPSPRPDAHVVELDDEDPIFDELDEHFPEYYRRAVGE